MMLGYKSNNHVVYSCKYHVIWCPKYRRKVLVGDIAKRLEEIMRKTALKYRAEISALEIVPDQVHLLCEVDPQFGIHRFVKSIKGVTSHVFQKRIRQPPKAPAKSVDEFVLGLNRGRCTARSHEAVRGESKECLTNTLRPRPLVPSVTAAVARSHCSLIRRFESQAGAAKVVLFLRCPAS